MKRVHTTALAAGVCGLLLGAVQALAAPRVPYGGELLAYVFGAQLSPWPREIESAAQASASRALFEPLYRIGDDGVLVPVLAAGPPVIDGLRVTVPLRKDVVRHDGKFLSAADVVESFTQLALRRVDGRRSAGGHLLVPITGGRERLIRDVGPLGITADERAGSVSFNLVHPDANFPRLLASRHAGIVIPTATGPIGTGPFKLEASADKALRISAFLSHRDGRPFLDAVDLRRHVSRSGVLSLLRRGDAALVLGAPDPSEAPATKGQGLGGNELLVIRVGVDLDGLDAPKLRALFDAALDRQRLVERHLGKGAEPTRALVPLEAQSPAEPLLPSRRPTPAVLRVPRTIPVSHRFLERLQLDLLRAGLSVAIERPESEVPAGALGLELMAIPLDGPATRLPADRLDTLLGIAAALGRYDQMPSDQALAELAAAEGPEAERQLAKIEAGLRESLSLVPIGFRPTPVAARADVVGLFADRHGAVSFADAFLEEER